MNTQAQNQFKSAATGLFFGATCELISHNTHFGPMSFGKWEILVAFLAGSSFGICAFDDMWPGSKFKFAAEMLGVATGVAAAAALMSTSSYPSATAPTEPVSVSSAQINRIEIDTRMLSSASKPRAYQAG